MAEVNPDDFKGAMGSWAAGVTVVITEENGKFYGLTASSFSSLSLDPPLVLVCVNNGNHLSRMIRGSQKFGVSILAEGQDEVSGAFAKSGREPVDSLAEFEPFTMETGSPLLPGALGYVDCTLEQAVDGGDHTIFIGRVQAARFDDKKKPLVYFRRGYRDLVMD